jgi:glycosyltransferase involved in cell wall biosynthesis
MKILFLEPFYGGSHKDFADGLISHSRFDIDLHTLPARFWKWRMRGASLHFAQTIENPEDYDLLLVSDLMSLSDLKALWGQRCPPALVYFHENQLSYPLSEGEKMDYQFGFTDITTGLAADGLIFNSQSHKDAFLGALPGFIKKMPEYKPHLAIPLMEKKSSVIYPGCHFPPQPPLRISKHTSTTDEYIPLVIWNHRWEFDKNPETFFRCLYNADAAGEKFEIVLLGENFKKIPDEFLKAKEYFGDRIRQFGWAESRLEYQEWLSRGDIVISTSNQENFGISMVEAIYHGARPLLPRRLSYPELIPESLHREVLYDSEKELFSRFREILKETREGKTAPKVLVDSMSRFSWENIIKEYDCMFESFLK